MARGDQPSVRSDQGLAAEADPDDLLEIVPYEVQRVENRLGIYDAPAMKVRRGTEAVDILPVGRFSLGPVSVKALFNLPLGQHKGDTISGRVDITDGERKHMLFRFDDAGQDEWWTVDEQSLRIDSIDTDWN